MIFTPSSLSQTVTLSQTPSPLERDILYGRPHSQDLLHWLSDIQRIKYKLVLLIFKDHQHANLNRILMESTSTTSMTLRSASLLCPKFTSTCYGDRAFRNSAPVIWNALSADFNFSYSCNVFKKHLKSYLFDKAFNQLCQCIFSVYLWILGLHDM